MRIRKRSQSVAPATHTPLPISYKYQTSSREIGFMSGTGGKAAAAGGKAATAASPPPPAAVCSNMQENRCSDDDEPPASPQSSSDVYAEPPVMDNLRLSDAHVKEPDSDEYLTDHPLEEAIADKASRRRQSPMKRRKIEHESSPVFEGSASMTAAELLVVNELANGVRQRLHAASEHSATTEVTKTLPTKPLENSKDALISSIFFVFGTCGENGLSASEVVKYMLDQGLPGLKEGGARHTVQVANVLRSSSSFISLGDKKYLLCSTLDVRTESKKPTGSTRQAQKSPAVSPGSASDVHQDASENEDDSVQHEVKPRRGQNVQPSRSSVAEKSPHSNTRSCKKPQQGAKLKISLVLPPAQEERRSSDGEPEPVVVKTTRRRGPSSSQKGKGPTQCKRYDGRGWQCSRLTEPGYSLCVHHQDLINKRAAKLKEQQTLSRLMESVQRKAKSQPAAEISKGTDRVVESTNAAKAASRERETMTTPGAPVQKRKMLSLLAIK